MEVVSNSLKKIKIKFSLFFVLFVAALFLFAVAASRQQLRQATSITVSIAGMPVLQKIAAFIDGDKYERLAQTLDETDPFYIETQEKIRATRSNTHCLYLYTMAPYTQDVHHFIFDSEPPGSENFSPLGAEEDISDYIIDYRRTYENKTPQFTPLMFQSKWGRLISAYMPILNSNGDAVGIIGIDFEGQNIYDAIFINALRQISFSLVFIIIGMFIYFYLL
ncbi:MAG: hypothetical protein LBQ86_03005 [Holophagales bacterium]|jgi:hypothetical protein|nr:hypothetical protein [Holophagales bacterium]